MEITHLLAPLTSSLQHNFVTAKKWGGGVDHTPCPPGKTHKIPLLYLGIGPLGGLMWAVELHVESGQQC